ncbi:hypothetical protein WME79_38555 [Sorangium sp. So ce726]|uniref:GAP1-N1 domain-containing protein n=1 Tax=Sorangium sp. So ce726 TaxID=3133319 RepID=UPI003F5F62A0
MIAQTLHGYDQGHRLLAHGGDLDDAEFALLDRLSDLSGYVPLGTEFDRYYTGFLCGRYYAFACTWPDWTAPRAGTVHTHTLLIPLNALDSINDLWGLEPWHRQPASATDRAPYATELSLDLSHTITQPPVPASERATGAIVLWFGQRERPVLWVEDSSPDDVVRYLWGLLWPQARERFSFCTFALQVRHLRRRPFGFLALPPSSRGSFHERAKSPAWWHDGQLTSAALRGRVDQPWVRAILEGRADTTRSMPRFCESEALALIDEPEFPVFYRFIELEKPAETRLPAARARADLLDRLWPDLSPKHPLVSETFRRLLRLQSDAPLAPRPFWELGDFIRRPAVGSLAVSDPDFAAEVEHTIKNEVRRRLTDAPPEAIDGLVSLLNFDIELWIRDAIASGVGAAFAEMPDEDATDEKARTLLLGSTAVKDFLLVAAVLAALSPMRRKRVALLALQTAPEEARTLLADPILAAARRFDDLPLVVDTWLALNQPDRALQDATSVVLAAPVVRPERLETILPHVDAENRLMWALNVIDPRLAEWAGAQGATASERLELSDLITRCGAAPNGGNVLLAYLDQLPVAHRDEHLLSAPIAVALASSAASTPAAKRVAAWIAPLLVSKLTEGNWSAEQSTPWIRLGVIQRAIADASTWTLFSGTRPWVTNCLPNLARAVSIYVSSDPSATLFWVPNLLDRPLDEARSTSLSAATDELTNILALPPDRDGWQILAAQVLVAARRSLFPTAYKLVERTYPVLYQRLVRGELNVTSSSLLRRFTWYEWDIAKTWRHWLLDSWIDQRWPVASFLRCLGDDEALFRRVARRASHKRSGRDFLASLPDALAREPVLAEQWREPVARFFTDPNAPFDYD